MSMFPHSPSVVLSGLIVLAPLVVVTTYAATMPPDPPPIFGAAEDRRYVPEFSLEQYSDDGKVQAQPNWTMGKKRVAMKRFPWGSPDKGLANSVIVLQAGELFYCLEWTGDGAGLLGRRNTGTLDVTRDGKARFVAPGIMTAAICANGNPGEIEVDWQAEEPIAVVLRARNASRPFARQSSADGIFSAGDRYTGFTVRGLPVGEPTVKESSDDDPQRGQQWSYRLETSKAKSGCIVVDLGVVSSQLQVRERHAMVNGLDLSAGGGFYFAASPVRNELRNPSFERGLDYWNWTPGANDPGSRGAELVRDGVHGRSCLSMTTTCSDQAGHWERESMLASLPQQLDPGVRYVISAWAKRAPGGDAKPRQLYLGVGSNNRMLAVPATCLTGDFMNPKMRHLLSDEWRRFSYSFVAGSGGFRAFLAPLGGTVLVDAVQVERGETATPFVAPPVEPQVFSDGRIVLHGTPGVRVKTAYEIRNVFRETVWRAESDGVFEEDGMLVVPMGADCLQEIGHGVFEIRFVLSSGSEASYGAVARFARYEPFSDTSRPTATLIGSNFGRPTRYGNPRGYLESMRGWGFGSVSWGRPRRLDRADADAELIWEYGISNALCVVGQDLFDTHGKNRVDAFAFADRAASLRPGRGAWDMMRDFCKQPLSREQAVSLEKSFSAYLRELDASAIMAVSWWNEEEGGPGLVAEGRFEEYFCYQDACARAVSKVCPNLRYAYSCGPSNLRDYKIDIIRKYLETAARHGRRYGALPFHAYGFGDGGLLGRNDLDAQIGRLVEVFRANGYGPETPMMLTEFGNERYLDVPEWHTLNGDAYSGGLPGYSIGHYEVLHAAAMTRVWFIALKYAPWMVHASSWSALTHVDASYTPAVPALAAHMFGRFFPDVRFVASARPSSMARVYAFRRPNGSGVAAIWAADPVVDAAKAPCPHCQIRPPRGMRLFDMMGNERAATGDFALTYLPLIVIADDANELAEALAKASVRERRTHGDDLSAPPTTAGGEGEAKFLLMQR